MWYFNIIIILIFAFTHTDSKAPNKIILPINEDKINDDKASECIRQIIKDNISCKSIISIISSSNHENMFLRSINEYNSFSIFTRSLAEQKSLIQPDVYLIFTNNSEDFLKGLHKTSQDLSWNPKAKFVIFFRNRVKDITEIFLELINSMVFNVILLMKATNNQLEAFTYDFHNSKYCNRNASSIRRLGYCSKLSETLFPDMSQNGFANCTFIVAIREELPFVIYNNTEYVKYLKTGAEQFVLETIAQQVGINFKYKFISLDEDFGIILPNRTGTGLLGYLTQHQASIVAGGLFLSGNRLEVFDYVYGYSFAMYTVITPILHEKRWTRVYKQFSGITWTLIVVSFFFTLIVVLITKALTTEKSEDEFLMILKLWRYFYGQADVKLIKDRYVKRFLIVWIIFTSCIYAFYNTASYSLITGHVQDKIKINHSNLAALPFKPCISDFTRFYFLSAYNESFPNNDIADDSQCQSSDMVFNRVSMRNDLYTVDTDYAYYLRAINYLDSESQPTIKIWNYPRTDILSIYLTKGFPLKKLFQKYATKIYETGLLQRHLSYIYSRKPKPIPTLKKKYSVIRLEDFKIHYCVLLIGSLISFICFIVEYKMGN